MTNVPAALRDAARRARPVLDADARPRGPVARRDAQGRSSTPHDGRPVEAVLMRYRDGRRSLCLSSQSGCPLTCTFCATGAMKFGRNLTAERDPRPGAALPPDRGRRPRGLHGHGRAADEPRRRPRRRAAAARPRHHPPPHDDLDGRLAAGDRAADRGPRADPPRASASTRPDDALRSQIMPVNERYPLADVLAACRRWHERKRRRVFIEYVMLAGVNDRYEQALAARRAARHRRLQGQPHPVQPDGHDLRGLVAARRSTPFRAVLEEHRVPVTVRLTRGRDIDAACGQLAAAQA